MKRRGWDGMELWEGEGRGWYGRGGEELLKFNLKKNWAEPDNPRLFKIKCCGKFFSHRLVLEERNS